MSTRESFVNGLYTADGMLEPDSDLIVSHSTLVQADSDDYEEYENDVKSMIRKRENAQMYAQQRVQDSRLRDLQGKMNSARLIKDFDELRHMFQQEATSGDNMSDYVQLGPNSNLLNKNIDRQKVDNYNNTNYYSYYDDYLFKQNRQKKIEEENERLKTRWIVENDDQSHVYLPETDNHSYENDEDLLDFNSGARLIHRQNKAHNYRSSRNPSNSTLNLSNNQKNRPTSHSKTKHSYSSSTLATSSSTNLAKRSNNNLSKKPNNTNAKRSISNLKHPANISNHSLSHPINYSTTSFSNYSSSNLSEYSNKSVDWQTSSSLNKHPYSFGMFSLKSMISIFTYFVY